MAHSDSDSILQDIAELQLKGESRVIERIQATPQKQCQLKLETQPGSLGVDSRVGVGRGRRGGVFFLIRGNCAQCAGDDS